MDIVETQFSSPAQHHLEKARSWISEHRFALALVECDAAVRIAPDWADAHFLRGTVLENLEREEAAVQAYREAVRLDPKLHGVAESLLAIETSCLLWQWGTSLEYWISA
jgi:Tfp pilus assembly protein PilF